MRYYKETTEWAGDTPNHIYALNESRNKMYGYIIAGSPEWKIFKRPIAFDTRGRTFEDLGEIKPPVAPEAQASEWTVPGSKGQTYIVRREAGGGLNYTCSCPGFTYRGSCKHVAEFQSQHNVDIR